MDIVGKGPEGQNFIVDWKTKEDEEGSKSNKLRFSDSSDCGLWGDLLWRGSDDERGNLRSKLLPILDGKRSL